MISTSWLVDLEDINPVNVIGVLAASAIVSLVLVVIGLAVPIAVGTYAKKEVIYKIIEDNKK